MIRYIVRDTFAGDLTLATFYDQIDATRYADRLCRRGLRIMRVISRA